MEPYAPSRQEIITAFSNWESAGSADERIEVAKSSRNKVVVELDATNYTRLVKDPDFLAGIIDGRGYVAVQESFNETTNDEYGWISRRLRISTRNRPLLEALQQEYSGSIQAVVTKGSMLKVGRGYPAQHDSLRWVTGHAAYNRIMNIAGNRLRLL